MLLGLQLEILHTLHTLLLELFTCLVSPNDSFLQVSNSQWDCPTGQSYISGPLSRYGQYHVSHVTSHVTIQVWVCHTLQLQCMWDCVVLSVERHLLLCCSRDDTLRLIDLRQNSITATFRFECNIHMQCLVNFHD